MPSLIASALLAGVVCAAGTKLSHEGRLLFEAHENVSYGAAYTERAVRATVNGDKPTHIAIFARQRPRRVFLNAEPLPDTQWRFDDQTKTVQLNLPAGASSLQLRFDDLASLKPVPVEFPIAIDGATAAPQQTLRGRCVDEMATAQLEWNGEPGLYRLDVTGAPEATLQVSGGTRLDLDGRRLDYLGSGSNLQLTVPAPGGVCPKLHVRLERLGGTAALKPVDRPALLARADALFAEGEAFRVVTGEAPSISTSHLNTHQGGCIYNWGFRGGCLEWTIQAPADGSYHLAFVTACAEPIALRLLEVNGTSQALLEFPGTGGWGRGPASQWQALVPQANGQHARYSLRKGPNVIRLANPLGQHLNLDCIIAFPAD